MADHADVIASVNSSDNHLGQSPSEPDEVLDKGKEKSSEGNVGHGEVSSHFGGDDVSTIKYKSHDGKKLPRTKEYLHGPRWCSWCNQMCLMEVVYHVHSRIRHWLFFSEFIIGSIH